MWPTFAGGAFRGILLLANGQFKGSRRRCSWVDEGAYWVPTGCQSFVLQCPNYFIDLPSTFVQFGVLHTLRHPRVFQGIHAHPWVDQATTLTSLISGMRGNVAIWQRQWQRKGLSVFRAKRRHNDDGCSMHIHCPSPGWHVEHHERDFLLRSSKWWLPKLAAAKDNASSFCWGSPKIEECVVWG